MNRFLKFINDNYKPLTNLITGIKKWNVSNNAREYKEKISKLANNQPFVLDKKIREVKDFDTESFDNKNNLYQEYRSKITNNLDSEFLSFYDYLLKNNKTNEFFSSNPNAKLKTLNINNLFSDTYKDLYKNNPEEYREFKDNFLNKYKNRLSEIEQEKIKLSNEITNNIYNSGQFGRQISKNLYDDINKIKVGKLAETYPRWKLMSVNGSIIAIDENTINSQEPTLKVLQKGEEKEFNVDYRDYPIEKFGDKYYYTIYDANSGNPNYFKEATEEEFNLQTEEENYRKTLRELAEKRRNNPKSNFRPNYNFNSGNLNYNERFYIPTLNENDYYTLRNLKNNPHNLFNQKEYLNFVNKLHTSFGKEKGDKILEHYFSNLP